MQIIEPIPTRENTASDGPPHSATATSFIRKMRGASQAHLLRADDGHSYIVKFSNNPQHRRVLVNELLASVLLHHLHISTPQTAIIRITDRFLSENSEVYLESATERESVLAGGHFGSRYPVDVGKAAVYDFLPDALINKIVNVSDFLGAYVVDKWLANSDKPQAIFFRTAPNASVQLARSGFIMQMIDYGCIFDAQRWQFPEPSSDNMYFRQSVYQQVTSLNSFQPWLDEVMQFPESVIEQASKQVPQEWLKDDDAHQLEEMLEKLVRRRQRVADLVLHSAQTVSRFPNWHNPAIELKNTPKTDGGIVLPSSRMVANP